jgi:hypothetical protein
MALSGMGHSEYAGNEDPAMKINEGAGNENADEAAFGHSARGYLHRSNSILKLI